jgi:hypothetical protein
MTLNLVTQNYLESNFLRPTALLNGGFDHWQRGTTLNETELTAFSNYCADQWRLTFPALQQITVTRAADFVTSNTRSNRSLGITLSNTTSSFSAGSQYSISQRIEGIYARDLLYRPTTFSGKVKTNTPGIYSAFISWVDTASSNYYYCTVPITLLGTGAEETFTANFPPCPTTFTPQRGEAYSVKIGFILAGNATSVTGVYLSGPAASETYCNASQVNLFASSSNYINFSQLTVNPGTTAKIYHLNSYDEEAKLCQRYIERKVLSSHLVNLYANTTSHTGSISYERKLSATPSFIFQQTDESKSAIANSSAVYYVGGNTAFTLGTFAAASRTTNKSTKFTFTTTSATPVGVDTGNINLDVLVISNL